VKALSFNADYLNWFRFDMPLKHVIRVMEVDRDDDDPGRTEEKSLCDTLILAGEIRDELAREKGTRVYVMKQVKEELAREKGTRVYVMKQVKEGVWERIRLEVDSKK
jgi:hypothetical protein